MIRNGVSTCLVAVLVFAAPIYGSVCPNSCVCSTTRDSLHRAACSNLAELYKFSLRNKHHNINILDLSHNNITKLTHELDRLTEVVTLDLSTNGIKEINKFLHNAKKLVHLNLANNRIEKISLSHLPSSVSSLDLTNNLMKDVPSDLGHLKELEHLEIEGNPLDCSCENIIARDYLLKSNVHIDNVLCVSPLRFQGKSWLELKTKEICKITKSVSTNYLDMMMGDQPIDAELIGRETTQLKSMPLVALNDLDDGDIIDGGKDKIDEDDDSRTFIKAEKRSKHESDIEGSGEMETTTFSNIGLRNEHLLEAKLMETEEIMPAAEYTTEDGIEGSGFEGSGIEWAPVTENDEFIDTTPVMPTLYTGPVHRFFDSEVPQNESASKDSTEYPTPKPINVFLGGQDWINKSTERPVQRKAFTPQTARDTTISEQIRITQAVEVNEQASSPETKSPPHKTGTYVCIAIIVVLLVGLIGFAIIKGQMRKRRDRRLLRQQRSDVEKASKEMVDMNKSLLGKPAPLDSPIERKANGKYELVPTHEPYQKKGANGDVGNGVKHNENNGLKSDSPRDTNQNKNSSKDNNLDEEPIQNISEPQHETSFDSTGTEPDSKKDTHSLSSEDIFVPINDDDTPQINGIPESDLSHPLLNGDQNTDSDFLSPSREYVPVYSPDMGRVRIKLSETPKPKTPVLVTRSRSNAGDIIVTPALDGNIRKSTT